MESASRFKGHAIGLCVSTALIVHSVFFYRGNFGEHMGHWVVAAILYGFLVTSLSREALGWDAAFVVGLVVLNVTGVLYWHSQDVACQPCLDDEYLSGYPWFWGFAGFGLGRATR